MADASVPCEDGMPRTGALAPLSLPAEGEVLPGFAVAVTMETVRAYAEASGDHNPIHIDEAFAATTPFGVPIAHGMLLLAYLSRLITNRFGAAWVGTGRLDARFRSPALVGSTITVGGEIKSVREDGSMREVECAVHVSDAAGQSLVTATVILRVQVDATA